jgi:hypothetical protein
MILFLFSGYCPFTISKIAGKHVLFLPNEVIHIGEQRYKKLFIFHAFIKTRLKIERCTQK